MAVGGCAECQRLLDKIEVMKGCRRIDDKEVTDHLRDTDRLDWLLKRISGQELIDLGVDYFGGTSGMRDAIDKAM